MDSASVSPARIEIASSQERVYVYRCRVFSIAYAGYKVLVYAV